MTQTSPRSVADLNFKPKNEVFPSPRDWRDQFIYQLLVDRFDDGKDHPAFDPATAPRGRDPKNACQFQGGQFRGITRRLDYIQGLGCTAVWVSPPFKNRIDLDACHGYGIQDFLAVDPRLGTLEDLQELVREAHRRGMYVVFDIVINHSGDVWGYVDDEAMQYNESGRYDFGFWRRNGGERVPPGKESELQPDDGVWPIELQDPECYKRRGSIRDFGNCTIEEAVNGDFCGLKDLELNNPKVIDALIKCFKYWIAVTDVDGYRMDTVKHADPEPMAIFCNAIHEYAKSIGKDNFIIFGEVVDNDETLKKYVGNKPVDDNIRFPMLDACLDFPLYFVLEEVIKGFKSPQTLRDRYESFRYFYRDFAEAGRYYVTFVDNHDQMSRPFRRFMHGVDDPRQAILAIGYLLTNLGTPCIYYGTEQGFDGAGSDDLAVRECMFGGKWGAFDTTGFHFFNPDHPIYKGIAKIAHIRAAERTLRVGREYFREISGNGKDFGHPIDGRCTLAFARVLDTESIIVAMNLDWEPRNDYVLCDGNLNGPGTVLRDLLSPEETFTVEEIDEGKATVRVPMDSRQMRILKAVTA